MKIIDIHCHPATKVNFGHRVEKQHTPLPDALPSGMHVDIPNMLKGDVSVAVSVHYIVERGLLDATQRKVLKVFLDIIRIFSGDNIDSIIEDKSVPGATFRNTLSSIQKFESAINNAKNQFNITIPKTFQEFDLAWQQNKTIFLHSIEGGHVLGNNEPLFVYEANIDQLFRAGICQLTIAHFFENEIVSSQGGIPPESKKLLQYDDSKIPKRPIVGLNPNNNLGESIINKLMDIGIIIDLVHSPPVARQRIFEINKARQSAGKKLRPLIFSHTGIQACINPANNMLPADIECLPSDNEVREIIACGGVIGVIFMNYWLVGKEEDDLFKFEAGLPLIINTIMKLREIGGGSCDHIAIGSDLDGFSQVPDDLVTSAQMQLVPIELANNNFTEQEIKKICHENYLRVLQLGWGN